jgi:hypothetical protein
VVWASVLWWWWWWWWWWWELGAGGGGGILTCSRRFYPPAGHPHQHQHQHGNLHPGMAPPSVVARGAAVCGERPLDDGTASLGAPGLPTRSAEKVLPPPSSLRSQLEGWWCWSQLPLPSGKCEPSPLPPLLDHHRQQQQQEQQEQEQEQQELGQHHVASAGGW